MLHVKTSWVYRASRRGELPCVPVGRYRRYDPEKVEAWIKGKRDAA